MITVQTVVFYSRHFGEILANWVGFQKFLLSLSAYSIPKDVLV